MSASIERLSLLAAALIAALAVAGVEPAARVLPDQAGLTIVIGLKPSGHAPALLARTLSARLEIPVEASNDEESCS
jgi:hypothetical protein